MNATFTKSAAFLGPKAEHKNTWQDIFTYIFQDYVHWRKNYFPEDPLILDRAARRHSEEWFDELSNELDWVLSELKADCPFYSPRYQGHMVSENLLPGVAGYFAGMLYNPNNVSSESAPITIQLELAVGKMVAKMLGYNTAKSWAHLTSGGTIANLEALWAARQNQLNGLSFQEICDRHEINLEVVQANGRKANIRELNKEALIGLSPSEQIRLPERFSNFVRTYRPDLKLIDLLHEVKFGSYSITKYGLYHIYSKLEIEPIILVSQAAHYSIRKIANLLGLGENNVRHIPVNKHFQIDPDALHEMVDQLAPNQVILAIIGVLGTTEEGAIDPIDQIVILRKNQEKQNNRSFWIHVDAAWGGYLPTVGTDHPVFSKHVQHALQALPDADSITIDPHKLGYIPYPAGIICFRDQYAVLHAQQVAPYITTDSTKPNPLAIEELKNTLGPFILEGSKPGAAAVSAWLTHKSIPLDELGHGQIILHSLEQAQRLYQLILHQEEIQKNNNSLPFYVKPLSIPDCNVVCYFFQLKSGEHLAFQNQLNQYVYDQCSLQEKPGTHEMPYRKPYFISHTHFYPSHYPHDVVKHLIRTTNTQKDYARNGLFVLRSVVMNPWLSDSFDKGKDHLEELILHVTHLAREGYHLLAASHEEATVHQN